MKDRYSFIALFHYAEDGIYISFPDLAGCRTCGKDLADAIFMAEDAVAMWLWDAESKAEKIPVATVIANVDLPQFVNYIAADTDEYRKKYDNRAVKKTLSIPSWLNTQAEQAGVNFSQILQEALNSKLNVG